MTDTVAFAKKYVEQGWQVFPLQPRQKTPIVKWADVATTDEKMAVGWWDNDPDANIGIACGKRSGIVVLDVDVDKNGYESLAALRDEWGELPETAIAKTGGGGEHIFFKHPGIEIRNSAGKLGPGLDIRGDGGYVVAAPSIHPNGQSYEWVVKPREVGLADMPKWLIDLLFVKEKPVPVVTNGKIANGSRNDTLARKAGSMRRSGFSEDEIYQALLSFNKRSCMPPLSDGEVLLVARSISRYQPQNEPANEVPQLTDAESLIDGLESEIQERERDPRAVWGIHYAWPFLSLVTGGKQKGELIYLGGEPGVGKSWWAFQDAMQTAIGNPSKKIEPVPTCLWSGEMPAKTAIRRMFEILGVPKRRMLTGKMEAYWHEFNVAKATLLNSPLYISDQPLSVENADDFIAREMGEHGVEYFVFDYDWLISAKGDGEIETSQAISRTFKTIARKRNVSIMLLSSVNKLGMDTTADTTKSNLSGSGKKIHDADIVYLLTKLNEKKVPDDIMQKFMPKDYWKIVVLNIGKGRDLDYHVPDKKIMYARETPNPKFRELRELKEHETNIDSWLERSDLK